MLSDHNLFHSSSVAALPGQVDPGSCSFKLLSTKVEVRLAKSESIHWIGLEAAARAKTVVAQPINVSSGIGFVFVESSWQRSVHDVPLCRDADVYSQNNVKLPIKKGSSVADSAGNIKNVYPSSSKHRVDWNRLEQEVKKEVSGCSLNFLLCYLVPVWLSAHKILNLLACSAASHLLKSLVFFLKIH